jgi:hypothetical protein
MKENIRELWNATSMDDEVPSGKDNQLFHLQDHQCKGRRDQFKDRAHRKDGVWIQK